MQLTDVQKQAIADLEIQSMMFDMDIDWEAAVLIQKRKEYKEEFWLTRWKEKLNGSDYTVIDNGF